MSLRWSLPACLAAALLAAACGEPPHKEMDQAQGALDAARAAGAEQYAATEYQAAADALKRSHDAVAQSDYRLALNYALDSRERAQNAAREAADTKAQVRVEVERAMADVATLLAQASVRLEEARKARVPRRLLTEPADAIAAINTEVQKAGEALRAGNYLAARPLLQEIRQRLEQAIAALERAMTTGPPRRRR